MNSAEWQARIDADPLMLAHKNSTWAQEARKHCPSCFVLIGRQHDSSCETFGEVARGADV